MQEQVFDFDSIKPFFENFSSTFEMISPEDKRRLIGVFIEKIEISIPKDKSEGRIKIKPWNLQTLDLSYEDIVSSSFEPTSLPDRCRNTHRFGIYYLQNSILSLVRLDLRHVVRTRIDSSTRTVST